MKDRIRSNKAIRQNVRRTAENFLGSDIDEGAPLKGKDEDVNIKCLLSDISHIADISLAARR